MVAEEGRGVEVDGDEADGEVLGGGGWLSPAIIAMSWFAMSFETKVAFEFEIFGFLNSSD